MSLQSKHSHGHHKGISRGNSGLAPESSPTKKPPNQLCGVGIVFQDKHKDGLYVSSLVKDGPAFMSHGISTGDILLEIDGVDVADAPLLSLVCARFSQTSPGSVHRHATLKPLSPKPTRHSLILIPHFTFLLPISSPPLPSHPSRPHHIRPRPVASCEAAFPFLASMLKPLGLFWSGPLAHHQPSCGLVSCLLRRSAQNSSDTSTLHPKRPLSPSLRRAPNFSVRPVQSSN